jgi:hypothetical protein
MGIWDEGIALISNAWDEGKAVVNEVVDEGTAVVSNAWDEGKAVVNEVVDEGTAVVSNAWDEGKAVVNEVVDEGAAVVSNAWDEGKAVVNEVVDEGAAVVSNAWDEGKAVVNEVVDEGTAVVSNAWDEGKAVVNEVVDEGTAVVSNAWDKGTTVVTDVWNYIKPSNLYEDQGVEPQYRLSPTNPAFVDAELSFQDMTNGYHLEYNENGILWRVKSSGEPHPEDLIKYYQQLEYKDSIVGKPILDKINGFLDFVDDASTATLMMPTPVLPVDVAAVFGKGFAFAGKGIIKGGEAIIRAEKATEVAKGLSNAAEEIGVVAKEASNNYRVTFFTKHPELEGKVVVHHGVEQQVLKMPNTTGLFTKEEINAYNNLRGIPKEINSEIHLSKIRIEWNDFYRENPFPSKEDLLMKRQEIDMKYGKLFNPPLE